MKVVYNEMVPMRDGVRLASDIFLPEVEGAFPVVFMRTPYGKRGLRETALFYVSHGYAVVLQDCRGRFDSEGTFYAWHQERPDGFWATEWIGKQPWCNGRVGTIGGSYLGCTQWLSAPLRSRYLKCMVPDVCPSDCWEQDQYVGGEFSLNLNVSWALDKSGRINQGVGTLMDLEKLYWHLPIGTIDEAAGFDVPFLHDWLEHECYDAYWKDISDEDKFSEIDIAVLNTGGWYDAYAGGALAHFTGMRRYGKTENARRSQKVLLGGWSHGRTDTKCGEFDFGPAVEFDVRALELRFLDYWLKGTDNGVMAEPPIHLFVMGVNGWYNFEDWPPDGARTVPYYLHSEGKAAVKNEDGLLSTAPPAEEVADVFDYDPCNPVPTLGGNHSAGSGGIRDQRPIEARDDVLVYTSAPLKHDLAVVGSVSLKLYISSSAPDTDFVARLVDVFLDGYAMNICEGILRTCYREGREKPVLMAQGEVYELTISLGVTANVFRAGHRIRLDITSSSFPRFARNLNMGHPIALATEIRVAKQMVHHSKGFPSCLLLPVLADFQG
jgi:putative CocE/NonD family hydrolase